MIVDTTAIIIDLVNLCHQRHCKCTVLVVFGLFIVAPNAGHGVGIVWNISWRVVMTIVISFIIAIITV